MDDGEVLLNEVLSSRVERASRNTDLVRKEAAAPTPDGDESEGKDKGETHTQWALGGNGKFMPVGATVPCLPSGIYEPFANPAMWGLERLSIASDGIYQLPDMATETVMKEVDKFWGSETKYREHKLLYKRGLLLWGPPGGGKTVTVKLLMNELVKRDGIVIIIQHIALAVMCMKAIRRIEPKRNLIVVLEDIDEIIALNGESTVLSMLDGENNIDNILHLATTNYPERLGARIINRPSRFDRRVYVGMPNDLARRVYLQKTTNNGLDEVTLERWVKDTGPTDSKRSETGMSIAHLRELVAAVYCLEQPYEDVIERLKRMQVQPKDPEGLRLGRPSGVGFTVTGDEIDNAQFYN